MSAEDHRALLERYMAEVWGLGDLSALHRFLSADFRRHRSTRQEPLDRDGQVARLQGIRNALPDVTITVEPTGASCSASRRRAGPSR
jgi:hypothetical protein